MNAICIVSAICTNNTPLDYTQTRSAFSHQQRFEQSMQTIAEVRKHVPDSYIIFIEGTKLDAQMTNMITAHVDHFFYASQHEWVTQQVESLYKGRGELASLLAYLSSDHYHSNNEKFVSLSKISGRYKPELGFCFVAVDGHIVAKVENNPHHHSQEYMSTMFYTVHNSVFETFVEACTQCYVDQELGRGVALEHIILMYIRKCNIPIHIKHHLYVGGEYGPWGGYVQH